MNLTISKSRENNKANKPVVKSIKVEPGQRGKLIGVGGLNLKRIFTRTGQIKLMTFDNNLSFFANNLYQIFNSQFFNYFQKFNY